MSLGMASGMASGMAREPARVRLNWRGAARRSLPYLVTASGGFILAYLLVAFFVFPATIIPSDTKVPNVVGMVYDDAVRTLRQQGFRVVTRERRYHASAPTGTVLDQAPVATVMEARGATIALDVSLGQRKAEVPLLAGLAVAQGRRALADAGFDVGSVRERESDTPRGQVIGTEPAEGTKVPLPSTVNLIVSSGPTTVAVPDVTGQRLSAARPLLEQLGFRVRVLTDSSSTMSPNTVVSQTPAAGRRVGAGSSVALTVAGSGTVIAPE